MTEGQTPEDAQKLWKQQEGIEMQMNAEEVCRRAQKYEKKAIREYSVTLVLLGSVVAVVLIYSVQIPNPFLRAGNAIAIASLLYIVAIFLKSGPPARLGSGSQADNCSNYLRAELKNRLSSTLKIRWAMLGLLLATAVSQWGGGPAAVAKWWGFDWLAPLHNSPYWPAWLIAGYLVLWILCSRDARKIQREIDRLGS